jgi:HAD superfamily hydrolase (TIGR01509 family)
VPDAVMFDLDGVLVDSESLWDDARQGLARERGGRWTPQATREMLGMSAPEWSRYMAESLQVPLPAAEIDAAVRDRVAAAYRRRLPLIPGADTAVRRLAAHWPLGLASSSNREIIELFLELSGLREQFAVTVSSEEVARGRPAPDVYLHAARRLGVRPERCVAVEDSSNGLRAAAAAAMAVVAVPNVAFAPDRDALAVARVTLASIRDLDPDVVRRAAGEA